MVIPQRQACFAEPSSATTTAGVIDQLQLRFLLAKAPLAVGLLKEGRHLLQKGTHLSGQWSAYVSVIFLLRDLGLTRGRLDRLRVHKLRLGSCGRIDQVFLTQLLKYQHASTKYKLRT